MRRLSFLIAVPVFVACFRAGTSSSIPPVATVERTRSLLAALADDSLTEMVILVAKAVRIVADGQRLEWNPGGKP